MLSFGDGIDKMKFLIVCLIGLMIGCESPQEFARAKAEQEEKYEGAHTEYGDYRKIPEIEYLRDKRTNLCFAYFMKDRGPAFSNVPCNNEVMKLIRGE